MTDTQQEHLEKNGAGEEPMFMIPVGEMDPGSELSTVMYEMTKIPPTMINASVVSNASLI